MALIYRLPYSMLVDIRRDLDLEFSRSNMEFAISQPKMVRNKNKYIDWNLGLKCNHHVWPWLWPWPWIFKVKHGICYTSAKNGPIAMKRKANISIELKASNVTIRFDLGHDLDLWIFKVKCDLDLWPHTWPWPWIAVTSGVSVPSTHLVYTNNGNYEADAIFKSFNS